jgi:hypothetical protein
MGWTTGCNGYVKQFMMFNLSQRVLRMQLSTTIMNMVQTRDMYQGIPEHIGDIVC